MHPFLSAVIGGALIGLSVVLLMFLSGRIAGISGIVGGLLPPRLADDWRLRLAFVAGLLLSPLILNAVAGFNGIGAPTVGFAILIPAGFLIGLDRRSETDAHPVTAFVDSRGCRRARQWRP